MQHNFKRFIQWSKLYTINNLIVCKIFKKSIKDGLKITWRTQKKKKKKRKELHRSLFKDI